MLKLALTAICVALTLGTLPATAEVVVRSQARGDYSAQVVRRVPPRLRVYPSGRRLLYRDCDFRLVQQWRPSGPVIVPWQHCWWVRG
ncbi:MAG: hypothetical protein JO000_05045 [Alphaproteobacteria bacterium]|nr:hypothetical protein [Alphaproteobacteria bacterium]